MSEHEDIQPWDSDHTALVHVLWAAQRRGLLPHEAPFDQLADFIRRSNWLRAVEKHAKEAEDGS